MDDDTQVRWLDESEQTSWRNYISATTLLLRELEQRLLAAHDLSMDDYAILVLLSEAPGRARRMSEIAADGIIARPHVTYRIARLEDRGIVERRPSRDDARGVEAHLTDGGFALLQVAARDHVTAVRERLLDPLTRDEFGALGAIMGKVFCNLAGPDPCDARRA